MGIIGAGPAGLTAGYVLAKAGIPVDVYEAGGAVGGMSRSLRLWNQIVDIGPHRFFSSDARINRLWLEIAGRDYSMVNRLTRIYYNGKFFHYPLTPTDALSKLGWSESARCILSYLSEKMRKKTHPEPHTFEAWVVGRFGRRLYEIFFREYSEKLWGIPCNQLDADFAAQRIRNFSLWEAAKHALGTARKQHKTLVDTFAYPFQGTGSIYERMAEHIKARGGEVHLNKPVHTIEFNGSSARSIQFTDGTSAAHSHVISSMPLTRLVQSMPHVPELVQSACRKLRFRHTIVIYLRVEADDLFPDQWLYIHAPELRMGRVTNFRNWVPTLYGPETSTILAAEFWNFDDGPFWNSEDSVLIEIATRELRSTGLLRDKQVTAGHVVRVPRCYPVYERGYRDHVSVVSGWLSQFNGLQVIGRYGSFKYNNQDHSILMGILAAENIVSQSNHNLWSLNSNYDSYQEEARIDATGLVPLEAR